MVYLPHYRLRVGGFLVQSDQTWSVGVNFLPRTAGGLDPTNGGNQDHLERWRDAVAALNGGRVFGSEMMGYLSAQGAITYVRTAVIGPDGKEVSVALYEASAPKPGGGTLRMPTQVAVVASMVTGRPGRANAGRMYLPALGAVINTSARIEDNGVATLATDVANWLTSVKGAGAGVFDAELFPAVLSSKGTAAEILRVRVGNRLDIQRRRADKEKEAYALSALSH